MDLLFDRDFLKILQEKGIDVNDFTKKSKEKVDRKLRALKRDIDFEAADLNKDQEKRGKTDFIKRLLEIEQILDRGSIKHNITLEQYIGLEELVKDVVKSKENGREDN